VLKPQSSPSVEPLLAHESVEVGGDLSLVVVKRLDLRPVTVEQLQAQPGRLVVAASAVAVFQRRQTRADGLGVG
jgi:hypothetical protein